MAVEIPVPSSAHSTIDVTLGGIEYIFTYRYNERSQRFTLSITLSDNTSVISGVTLMENELLLDNYILDNFNHGDLLCARVEEDGKPVGRENIGFNKPHNLIYISNEEIVT